jgi:hypothetical protein
VPSGPEDIGKVKKLFLSGTHKGASGLDEMVLDVLVVKVNLKRHY